MNGRHIENYSKLQVADMTSSYDFERKALFYILASESLYGHVLELYNFSERSINLDSLENLRLRNGQQKMIQLAFNLYNGNEAADPYELFRTLDETNFKICLEAIAIRFNIQ